MQVFRQSESWDWKTWQSRFRRFRGAFFYLVIFISNFNNNDFFFFKKKTLRFSQMDEDERYNRKLESGLYTLQVFYHNGMTLFYLIAFQPISCLGLFLFTPPRVWNKFVYVSANCAYSGTYLALWVSKASVFLSPVTALFNKSQEIGVQCNAHHFVPFSGIHRWRQE